MQKVGVISDTHGLLRPEALDALQGVDMIIHAGDSGGPAILEELSAIAPVHAVRGNCDFGPWAYSLPVDRVVETDAGLIYVLHDLYRLGLDPAAADMVAVIHGHTHMPSVSYRNGILYLNPGSAGPARSGKPVTLVVLEIDDDRDMTPRLVMLKE